MYEYHHFNNCYVLPIKILIYFIPIVGTYIPNRLIKHLNDNIFGVVFVVEWRVGVNK